MFPHRWNDEEFLQLLEIYNGPYIQAVRDDPSEFTRRHVAHEHLKRRASSATIR